jgi:hypothetical protein
MIEVVLTQGKVALIDDIDKDITEKKWFAHKNWNVFYVKRNTQMTNGKRITIRMHQIINKKTGIY